MKGECKQIRKLISAYVDGELSPDQKARVETELTGCDDCRAEYERLLRMRALVWEVFQQDLRGASERSVWEGVEARIAEIDAARAEGGSWAAGIRGWLERLRLGLTSPLAPAGVAAAVATVAIAAVLMVLATPDRTDTAPAPAHLDQVALPGEIPAFTPDQAPEDRDLAATGRRRDAEPERAFRRNELYVDSTDVDQGIVIVDVDPEADTPAIVWHLQEEPAAGEDGVI